MSKTLRDWVKRNEIELRSEYRDYRVARDYWPDDMIEFHTFEAWATARAELERYENLQ